MMKRVMLVAVLGMFCCNTNLSAMDALRNRCTGFGQFIEKINVPLIGKLTNVLPFALVAASFKECPAQTMMIVTGLLVYVLSRNEYIRELFQKYKAMGFARFGIKQEDRAEYDETLFIFDGEDEEDAEEEMEIEDELLEEDAVLLDDEYNDIYRDKKKPVEQSIIKFL